MSLRLALVGPGEHPLHKAVAKEGKGAFATLGDAQVGAGAEGY